ncbi:MAG: alkaline phosphatase family protein [Smithellaceae bacterium]|nr:alkaline phosphatase family protein [Smithellaceae bacterium]
MSRNIRNAYRYGQEDETMSPYVLTDQAGNPLGRFKPGDGVIFFNIRGEREIELTRSLTESDFTEFPTAPGLNLTFATMIEYQKGLPVYPAFPPDGVVEDTLSEIISRHALRQVKITEAEKSYHVRYFFNGRRETPFRGEDIIFIPTRKDVALFDEAPEMSIAELTEGILATIRDDKHDFILANLPNVDVVGHIENEPAVITAIEAVDRAAGMVIREARMAGITVIVTADHGSVEQWYYPDGSVDTGHSANPVPFVLLHPEDLPLRGPGELTDVAPTVLHLLGLTKPAAMTGSSLIAGGPQKPGRRVLLLLLDGWGFREDPRDNLIARAATPVMDRLWREYPRTTLEAAGLSVGLPAGTSGNSEAGHIHLGAGRRLYSDRVRIDRSIENGSFFSNEAFREVMGQVKKRGKALHLMGIVSFFSSHGSIEYLYALMEMARRENLREVYIHAMLGRRGELPESGAHYLERVEQKAAELGVGKLVSIIGRYWSLDREENWDRIEITYKMLVSGEGKKIRLGEN